MYFAENHQYEIQFFDQSCLGGAVSFREKASSLNRHRNSCLCVRCVICSPERRDSLCLPGKISGELLRNMVIVCNNLCEEVDSLLAVEVTISEEGSARSREAHHRQRHRDRHVHLDGGPFVCLPINLVPICHNFGQMIQMENSSTTSALRLFPQDHGQQDKSHPYLPNVDLVAESSGSRSVVREDRRPVAVPVGVD